VQADCNSYIVTKINRLHEERERERKTEIRSTERRYKEERR